jgi:hypothetical protein
MAETKWSNLDPRVPIARVAEVQRVGPGWAETLGKSEARDDAFHQPLPAPVVQEVARGEPPPPPTESELRAKLTAALAAEREAQAAVDKASAAHARAVGLLQTRKQALTGFDDLQATITRQTVDALRTGGRAEPTDDLREQINLREQARMNFAGADAAEQHFAMELHVAGDRLRVCEAVVSKAMAGVLGTAADGFVHEIRSHEAEIRRLQSKLLGFDRFAAAAGAQLPESVRDVLFTQLHGVVGSSQQLSVWSAAADVLRADPAAAIVVSDPPAPPSPPAGALAPSSYQTPHVAAVMAQQAKARAEQAEQAQAETPPEAA